MLELVEVASAELLKAHAYAAHGQAQQLIYAYSLFLLIIGGGFFALWGYGLIPLRHIVGSDAVGKIHQWHIEVNALAF